MKSLCIILFTLIFASCKTMQNVRKIHFRYYEAVHIHTVRMQIPKHYELNKIYTGGEGEEHRYLYSDSSLIYISDAKGSPTVNETLIRAQGSSQLLLDSIIYNGVTERGNYWKEIKYKGLFFGYSNVPPAKREVYDEVISSMRYK